MAMSNAERQKRYRDQRSAGTPLVRYRTKPDRRGRPARFRDAIATIIDLRDAWRDWRDALPETFEESPTAERLDEVLGLVEGIDWEELAQLELPRGYGRD